MAHDLQTLDRIFKALADPTRIRILGVLLSGEVCVCHIYESLRVPQPKASRHLAYLRRSGLVETRKKGQWVYYRLASRPDDVTQTLISAVQHCIGHLSTTTRDGKRLERRTGSGIGALPPPIVSCGCGVACDPKTEEFRTTKDGTHNRNAQSGDEVR